MDIERYVGLDIHKRCCMVGAADSKQHVVIPSRKVAMEGLESWAREKVGLL